MSVFDKLKAYSRKPAAVILATVMATSTIPTTPIAQAVTAAYAESTTAEPAKGAETSNKGEVYGRFDKVNTVSLGFDAHPAKGTDGTASCSISKKDLTEWLVGKLKTEVLHDKTGSYDAILNDAKAKAEAAHPGASITDIMITDISDAVAGNPTSDNAGVKAEIKDGNLTITSKTACSAKVNVPVASVKYKFTYFYTDQPSEGSKEDTGTGESTGAEDAGSTTKEENKKAQQKVPTPVPNQEGEYAPVDAKSYILDVNSSDIWANVVDNLSDKAIEGLVYKGEDKSVSFATGAVTSGLVPEPLENYQDSDKCFTAKVDADTYTVTVSPVKASKHTDPVSFDVNWLYPDNTIAKTTKVTVQPVARATVKLKLNDSYDARIQEKQQEFVKNSANKAVKAQIKEQYGDDIKVDYFSGVTFDDKLTVAGGSPKTTFHEAEGVKDDAYSNYQIDVPETVTISTVKEEVWSSTGIIAYADNGGNNKEMTSEQYKKNATYWLNGTGKDEKIAPVTFGWKDHMLTTADDPTAITSEELSKNKNEKVDPGNTAIDGDHGGIHLYSIDADGVITQTSDLAYRRDTAAPVLMTSALISNFNARNEKTQDNLTNDSKFVTKKLGLTVDVFDPNGDNGSGLSGTPEISYVYGKNAKSSGSENQGSGNPVGKPNGNLFTYDLSSNASDQKVYAKNINVKASDVAGNKMEKAVTQADSKAKIADIELIQNASAPTIVSGFDNNNVQREANGRGYYNANRTFTITVTDPFGDYVQKYDRDQVITTITDGNDTFNVTAGDLKDAGNDTWTFSYTFGVKGDADCKVSAVSYANLAGTPAASAFSGDTFTIDKTAPKLNVSWNTEAAQNGKYYNAARTATITVEEHNFDPNLFKIEAPVSAGNGDEATPAQIGGWSSNGDTHTATVTFPGQGVYTLSVSGEDLASNKSESYTSPEFVIDTIKPKIDIQNVVNRTAYAGEVAPTAAVHDTNLADGTSIEVSKISYPLSKDDPNPYAGAAINTSATDKSVSYLNPAKTKGNDGVYTLTVQAIDLAGNTESEAVTWSVNRFGSTYVISDNTGKMLDQYLKSSKTTDVKVTEINPSGLDDNKTSVELTRDTKNTTLKSGDNYTTDANTASGWSEYNYTVSKSNYDKDGAYRVLFHSEDAAGNSSENTMEGKNAKKSGAAAEINFAVDDTAPIASFVDLASNGKYEESSHKAKVSFEDNLKLSKAQIKVNGKTVATFTADQLEKSPIREFTLDGSSSKQDVTVVAWDAAGNKSKELKATGVLVTNDSFVLWMNNLPLMVGTIVAIVVVAGGIYMVVAKKRKENEEK